MERLKKKSTWSNHKDTKSETSSYSQEIKMEFCKTEEQLVDIFTKPIATEKFIKFRDMLGVQEFSRLRGSVED